MIEEENDSIKTDIEEKQAKPETDSCDCEDCCDCHDDCDCDKDNTSSMQQEEDTSMETEVDEPPEIETTTQKNHCGAFHKHKHEKHHAKNDNSDYKSEAVIARLTRALQQLQADFDNYRKRNQTLAAESKNTGIFEAVKAMLPAFDAVIVAKKQITDENTKKGLEMVERELITSLSSLNITQIKTVGEQYDPNLHNVVLAEEVEGVPSGEILEEYNAGFISPTGVVRFANVKIAK